MSTKQHTTNISKGGRHNGSGLDEQQETVERDAGNERQKECGKEQTTVVEANRLFLVSHDKLSNGYHVDPLSSSFQK